MRLSPGLTVNVLEGVKRRRRGGIRPACVERTQLRAGSKDLHDNVALRHFRQPKVDRGAVGRVPAGARVASAKAAAKCVGAPGRTWFEQPHVGARRLVRPLLERGQVVKNPECAAGRGGDQIIAMHTQVSDRSDRQVQVAASSKAGRR